jgi:release factor glutamine methyltransferase
VEEISSATPGRKRVVDFGTGSGCLAIAVAAKLKEVEVLAIDKSASALEVARRNAARNGVEEKITFRESDTLPAPEGELFDLLLSNPPYIPRAEIASLEPEVKDYDPVTALDGGSEGLDFYRLIAAAGRALLKPGGRCMVEFGDGQENAVQKLFEGEKWIVRSVTRDYSGRPRFLTAENPA